MQTKHTEVEAALRQAILEGRLTPGTMLPAEPELARRYGVHRLTLRKALAQLASEQLVSRQQGRGTFVTGTLAVRPPSTVLLVGGRDDDFYAELQAALVRAAQAAGWAALCLEKTGPGPLSDAESAHLASLLPLVSAIVCMSSVLDAVRPALPPELPLVVADVLGRNQRSDHRGWTVAGDDRVAARLATLHLAELGHERIAYVGPAHIPGQGLGCGAPGREHTTWRGYVDGLREAGLTEELAIGLPLDATDWQTAGDDVLVRVLGEMQRPPTAFVCDADFRASNVVRAASRLGWLAPRDYSVVGIFDTPWCHLLSPPLTSVSVEAPAIAEMALLLAQRPASDSATRVRIEPRLVVRGSCGPKPTHPSLPEKR